MDHPSVSHEQWLTQATQETAAKKNEGIKPRSSLGLRVDPLYVWNEKMLEVTFESRATQKTNPTQFCALLADGKDIHGETAVRLCASDANVSGARLMDAKEEVVFCGPNACDDAKAHAKAGKVTGVLDAFESKHAAWDAALQLSVWMDVMQEGGACCSINAWVGTEVLAQIAKLRVMRHAAQRWCKENQREVNPVIRVWGNPSTFSLYDVDSNAVRNSIMATVALVGGADELVLFPHAKGQELLAFHTLLVLREEISTWGTTCDHARGAFSIEALSVQLWGQLEPLLQGRFLGAETHAAFEQRLNQDRIQWFTEHTKRLLEGKQLWVGGNAFVDPTQQMSHPWLDSHGGALSLMIPGGSPLSVEYMRALVQKHGLQDPAGQDPVRQDIDGQGNAHGQRMQEIARQLVAQRQSGGQKHDA